MIFSAPLEVGTRLTSGFGQRWGTLHAGTDYGPPVAGTPRRPVLAVADGYVIGVGRGNGKADAWPTPWHSGLTVLQDLGDIGGDRMRAHYGHLDEYVVKPGEFVKAGQVIGYMGGSGANGQNDHAIHLHFGVSQNHARPVRAARWFGDPGWINSHEWLRGKGVVVGWTEPVTEVVIPVLPTPTPDVRPEVGQSGGKENLRSDASIRAICLKAGLGDERTSTGLLIERYQHQQQSPFQLVWDRHWGKTTEGHYRWVVKLQSTMNLWKGSKMTVDGHYDAYCVSRVRQLQTNNLGGTYNGVVDGIPGRVFCSMLGVPTHP